MRENKVLDRNLRVSPCVRADLTVERGVVEIESEWTARARERMGIVPRVKVRETTPAKPKAGLTGAPSGS